MTKTDLPTIVPEQGNRDEAGLPEPVAEAESAVPRGPSPAGGVEIVDVWSRTSPKYRRRAVIFLLSSALLFSGLGCFTFWIRTGHFVAPGLDAYRTLLWQAFNWRGENQITLTDMLFYPINAQRVPMMLVIVGLTLGALISVPILVAILYRIPAALIFVAIIAFLAVMPWLAVMVLIACRIAATRKIRMRYVSATLGLLPLVLYFVGATSNPSPVVTQLAPAEQIKLHIPWIFAMISAALLMAIVLALAKVVNYRPGVIAPLLAVSFVVPVILFETEVGRDELHYRLLERAYGPLSSRHFVDEDKATVIDHMARQRFRGSSDSRLSIKAIRRNIQQWWDFASQEIARELETLETMLARSQYEVLAAGDRFRSDYSKSKYVPNVLYLQARALDMRVDRELFKREARLQHYADFPSAGSRETWVTLLTRYPKSPLSAVARLRLACFYAREARVAKAVELLDELEGFESGEDAEHDGDVGLFRAEPPDASLKVSLPSIVQEGRKLRSLLIRNRDPEYDDAPLVILMRLDERHRDYQRNLRALKARYPNTKLSDNLGLRLALQIRSRTLRAGRLAAFVERHRDGDAIERALFELGSLYEEDVQPDKALETFRKLLSAYPDSPWVADASRRIELIERRTRVQG